MMAGEQTARRRVLIADARRDVREALTMLLDATDDFQVVREAGSARDAAGCADALVPDIILLDPAGAYDCDLLDRLARATGLLVLLTLRDGASCRASAHAVGAVVIDKGAGPEQILHTLRATRRAAGAA